MARDRVSADITRGSIWRRADGSAAVVRSIAAGHVCITGSTGEIEVLHVNEFRATFTESPYDARQVRSQFSMSVANLESFHAFWSMKEKRMYARSSACAPEDVRGAARGRPALPDDAIYVGTYSGSVIAQPRWGRRVMKSVEAFFDDLNDAIAAFFNRSSTV